MERNHGAPSQAAVIMQRFNRTGVAAGTAKRFQVFRMPAASATSDMKPMYGNIQRVMKTAASKLRGSCWKPLASDQTRIGAATTPMPQVRSSAHASTVATLLMSLRVASSPSRSLLCASAGTNAWLKAPSANRRRNRLGMRKATLKASVIAEAPNAAAISSSRSRPVTREASVRSEMVEAALNRLTGASVGPNSPRPARRGQRAIIAGFAGNILRH
jgi:hypothetical protein